jgi:hypothetical protein
MAMKMVLHTHRLTHSYLTIPTRQMKSTSTGPQLLTGMRKMSISRLSGYSIWWLYWTEMLKTSSPYLQESGILRDSDSIMVMRE